MDSKLHRIPTKHMTREEWLEERRKGLGGSDASVVVGLNPYNSLYSLWAEKTGRLPPQEDNEAMRLGRDLEQYVAQRWEEKSGKKVRRLNAILKNERYPFAHANIDREVIGENAGLECKTTSVMNLKKFKNGEYPDTYYCQCMHYMAVTGAARWYLAVLVLGSGLHTYTIQRDETEIQALMEAEEAFWKLVSTDTPPIPDGSEATSHALGQAYSQPMDGMIPLDVRESQVSRYLLLKQQIQALETEKDECENQLKASMGNYQLGECGKYVIQWSSVQRSALDKKALLKDYPDLELDQYYRKTTYREFNVKEGK